jgi:mannose-6-phosphate isomerase
MWMGTHPGGPSRVVEEEITTNNANRTNNTNEEGGRKSFARELSEVAGRLPFLFKLLAAEKPLSIQAHPNMAQAREGFARENEAGLAIDDPRRNYKDPFHKPEIICALVPMTLMAGFRKTEDILVSFLQLLSMKREEITTNNTNKAASKQPKNTNEEGGGKSFTKRDETDKREVEGGGRWFLEVINTLEKGDLEGFYRSLFGLSEGGKKALHEKCLAATLGTEPGTVDMWDLTEEFAAMYPDDPAMLAPLFLNLFTLEPGQAVFIPAGVLHAYIGGFGVELMAASDNVLRGGLSSKFVDIPELEKILEFKPFCPEIIYPSEEAVFRYPVPCDDFALYLVRGGEEFTTKRTKGSYTNRTNNTNKEKREGEERDGTHPTICIVTEGEVVIDGVAFKKGESFFASDGGALRFAGNFSLYAACSS